MSHLSIHVLDGLVEGGLGGPQDVDIELANSEELCDLHLVLVPVLGISYLSV